MGRGEDNLRRAFQNLSSSDSMDFRSLLLTEPSTNANHTTTNNPNHHQHYPPTSNHTKPDTSQYLSPDLDPLSSAANINQNNQLRKESDSESGFEDGSSSQMSRSLPEGSRSLLEAEAGMLSDSLESLQVEQVLTELQSVSVDWKTLRSARSCSCAMPFEHHVKKVGIVHWVM